MSWLSGQSRSFPARCWTAAGGEKQSIPSRIASRRLSRTPTESRQAGEYRSGSSTLSHAITVSAMGYALEVPQCVRPIAICQTRSLQHGVGDSGVT